MSVSETLPSGVFKRGDTRDLRVSAFGIQLWIRFTRNESETRLYLDLWRPREEKSDILSDGGEVAQELYFAEYDCGNRVYFLDGEQDEVPHTCPREDCESSLSGVWEEESNGCGV